MIYRERIIIEFWTKWCEASNRLDKYIKSIINNYKNLTFYRVNIDENKDCINKFNIKCIPTIIYFKDSKEMDRMIGIKNKNYLINFLDKARNDL